MRLRFDLSQVVPGHPLAFVRGMRGGLGHLGLAAELADACIDICLGLFKRVDGINSLDQLSERLGATGFLTDEVGEVDHVVFFLNIQGFGIDGYRDAICFWPARVPIALATRTTNLTRPGWEP